MKRIIIESPYAGDVERNLRYLRAAMRDCLLRGEAPFASHALYTQPGVLDDSIPAERELGIAAGFAWRDDVDTEITAVYADLGISQGMQLGIDHAKRLGRDVEIRSLVGWQHPEPETPKKRSCNRHADCDEADAKFKELHPEGRSLPYGGRAYTPDHCDDPCCEDCFGS